MRTAGSNRLRGELRAADFTPAVPVPLPEGVRHQRVGETTERSAHLEKLKQLFEAAPISRYLGMTLSYCENGGARVRLSFLVPKAEIAGNDYDLSINRYKEVEYDAVEYDAVEYDPVLCQNSALLK